MTHKKRKFIVCSAGCSLFKTEALSCSLDILHGDLATNALQFFWFLKRVAAIVLLICETFVG
jgi:hypothetical protein